jgi:ferric-dicitrate binding protein FerR (iron transport regulator)
MEDYKKNIEISRLIARELSGSASPEELLLLKNWLEEDPGNKSVYDSLKSPNHWEERKKILAEYDQEAEWAKLKNQIDIRSGRVSDKLSENQSGTQSYIPSNSSDSKSESKPDKQLIRQAYRQKYFKSLLLKHSWMRYAAAAVLVIMTGSIYFYLDKRPVKIQQTAKLNISDIVPGGNKAVLTLADGSRIILDSAKNGTLAMQGGTEIIKQDEGKLMFASSSPNQELSGKNKNGETGLNTVATPKGGSYMVELPDGSKAWLNAASSIKFPAEFSRKERRVEISGEVYFEVEKRKIPFIVSVANKAEVKVLGTHFNINSYADESAVRTTLVEGSVQVTKLDEQSGITTNEQVILNPGQQSELDSEGVIRVKEVNTSLYTAWKDDRFIFKDTPLEDIMRSMARWYDFDVIYADASLKSLCFTGNIPRGTSVEEIFILLGKTKRIQFQVTHKTITIMKEP